MNKKKKPVFKEPIFLFLGMGIILFICYSLFTEYYEQQNKKIYINNIQIAILKETFQKTWNRPPTEKEMNAQIENLIKDEVFYKEAVDMGLDRSDPAVKRRLRQMMELMMDDAATSYPSEDQLSKYLDEHPEKFMEDPVISFEQMYFAARNKNDAEAQLYNLSNNIPLDQSRVGNLALIPSKFENETRFSIDRRLGKQFTEELFTLDTGKWVGPIESAYGWHLIYISHIKMGKVPELAEIWDNVEREWAVEQKNIKKEQQYKLMKSNYKIVFEKDE